MEGMDPKAYRRLIKAAPRIPAFDTCSGYGTLIASAFWQ